jgi:hypothetical protein
MEAANEVGSALMFGVLAMGKLSKTYVCNACHSAVKGKVRWNAAGTNTIMKKKLISIFLKSFFARLALMNPHGLTGT